MLDDHANTTVNKVKSGPSTLRLQQEFTVTFKFPSLFKFLAVASTMQTFIY
jgi:hypothetical protein